MINTTRRSVLSFAAAAFAAAVSPEAFAAAATDADPSAWIVGEMNQLLSEVRADADFKKGDMNKIAVFVNSRIMPMVDFTRMTRTAVGPQWRGASAEQRAELQDGFRALLIRVYSGAFSSVKDYRAESVPGKPVSGDTPVIRTRLVSKTEQPVQVEYRMKQESGQWKVIDVNIAGIWMVQNYHSQFASVLANGGIPALIESMKDKKSSLNQQQK